MTAAATPGIQGVLGRLGPDELGLTQCHEHLSLDLTPAYEDGYRLNDLAVVGDDLRQAGRAGLQTIVDVGTDDHRRSPAFLRRLAEYSGLHVVASTGFWRDGFYPAYLAAEPVERVAEHVIRDLTEGIAESGVRAGVIGEIGSSADGMSPLAEKAFRACAIAQRETGVAFITHTPEGIDALTQLDLLTSCGVDPGRILIGHVDCLDDPELHATIARRGAFVGFDRVGMLRFQSDEVRLRLVLELLGHGHGDRLILSTDLATQSRMRVRGAPGYAYLLEVFVPRMRAAGVDDATLHQILVENPRRLLTGTPAASGTSELPSLTAVDDTRS